MGKRKVFAAVAAAAVSTLLIGLTTGSPGQTGSVAASSAPTAHVRTVDYKTSQHCTETDGFRGADTEMCVELDYGPDGFNDGGFTPYELRVIYGAPQWLIGYDYQVGIPNFQGCDVNVQMYTHDNGTPQLVAASQSYTCSSKQSSQNPYESPDGPEDEGDDATIDALSVPATGVQAVAHSAAATGTMAAALTDSTNAPQYGEIDVWAYDSSDYMALNLPAGQYCVSIWVVTGLENDASRNNPACFTLGA